MKKILILLLGAIALMLLAWFCLERHTPAIEQDLVSRSDSELKAAGIDWSRVEIDGRDVILAGVAPTAVLRDKAGEVVRQTYGVRTVNNLITVEKPVAVVPADPDPPVVVQEPESPPPVIAVVEEIPVVDADTCQQQFDGLLAKREIHFETSSAKISLKSYPLLDELAYIASKCPEASIEIEGHTDARGSKRMNNKLSQKRAESVVGYLIDNGAARERLSAVGYGESRPVADNKTEAGLAKNRRIEFNVNVQGN